jgi:hypothetical protein
MTKAEARLWHASLTLVAAAMLAVLGAVVVLATCDTSCSRLMARPRPGKVPFAARTPAEEEPASWPVLGEIERDGKPLVTSGVSIVTDKMGWSWSAPSYPIGPFVLRTGQDSVRLEELSTCGPLTVELAISPPHVAGTGGPIALHGLGNRYAIVIPMGGPNGTGVMPDGTLIRYSIWEFERLAPGIPMWWYRCKISAVLTLLALTLLAHSASRLRSAAPWFREGGIASWPEGHAKQGRVFSRASDEAFDAQGLLDGPLLYRAQEGGAGSPYRGRGRALEDIVEGTREELSRRYAGKLVRASLAAVAVALTVVVALAAVRA